MKRKEAAALGLVTYQVKNPCKRGHDSVRYTKGGGCVECVSFLRGITISRRNRSLQNNVLSNAAREAGKTTYVPENKCKYGHLLRYVESNNCVECDKFQIKKHKISQKFSRIKKVYSLNKNQYLSLVKTQNSCCKICGDFKENNFSLHIDHCHETNRVRALLCSKCNQGIGLLNHSPDLLRKAAEYCEK